MEKSAQKRNVLDWISEKANVSGQLAEKFFAPEFERVMKNLRANDDAIRSLVVGEKIGEGDPGEDAISLKALLKSAKSNFNRRQYMSAVSNLGRFHKKVYDITQIISTIDLDVDKVHHEFLFKDLGDEQKKYLQDLKKRLARQDYNYLVKEAGIMDFFYNIGTKPGRALAMWERNYPKQVGKLKKDTSVILQKSESLLSSILSELKEMSSARNSRNVDNYIKSAHKIVKDYQNYDKLFREYYNSNVKGFLEKVELEETSKPVEDAKQIEKQEIPVEEPINTGEMLKNFPYFKEPNEMLEEEPSTLPAPPPKHESEPQIEESELEEDEFPSDALAKELMQKIRQPGQVGSPKSPKILSLEEDEPRDTVIDSDEEGYDTEINLHRTTPGLGEKSPNVKSGHQKFINELSVLKNEDPIILRSQIVRYAKSIQNSDPEISVELFNIAKNIQVG